MSWHFPLVRKRSLNKTTQTRPPYKKSSSCPTVSPSSRLYRRRKWQAMLADTPARPTVGVSAANHGPLPKICSATLTEPPPLITAGAWLGTQCSITSRGRFLSVFTVFVVVVLKDVRYICTVTNETQVVPSSLP